MRYVILFIVMSAFAVAQLVSPLSTPPPTDSMPQWCAYLYTQPLNIRALDSAYKQYYTTHEFVKSNYTRYYKRLIKAAQPYITASGIVRQVTEDDIMMPMKNRTSAQAPTAAVWKAIGPNETYFTPTGTSGVGALCPWQANIYAIDIAPSNPNVLYAMGETGGFFKTTNKGKQWVQLETGVSSNGEAVCVHPTNPEVCFVGVAGGIIRTGDGGKTWAFAWKLQDVWVYEIKVLASNTQIVLAGTDKGLYRSTNGGIAWQKILNNTICDVELHSTNSNECYALQIDPATKRYEFWKSTDAGASFSVKQSGWLNGIPSSGGGRITVTPADAKRVYVILLSDSAKPYLLRSDNNGETWTTAAVGTTTAFPMNNGQGFYDLGIAASHTNADGVIVGTQTTYRSVDGGKTFVALGGYAGPFPIHPDLQDVKCSGGDTWIATDGGITLSTDFFADTKNAEARTVGLNGADFWGFDAGWNEDVLVGGRYHNGNTAWHENYGTKFYRMGGGEAATGYVNPIQNRRTYFSDIGSYTVSDDVNGKIISHPVAKYPNESYYFMEYSTMVWDPRCYNTVWLGSNNTLWRSTDGAQTYDSVFASSDLGAMIEHIVIARSNPNFMYVTQRSNELYDGKIWRTSDGGKTWRAANNPLNTTGGERRVSNVAVSGTNEKELWVTYRTGSKTNKVFRSINGGDTWINLTTPTIEAETISDIVHQLGTNGGVYIACDRGKVYYRNNTMSDWVLHGSGLPFGHYTRALKPFYRDNKLRSGSSMGIWEAPLYEHSKPVAQPSVDKFTTMCERDTFYFDDYSALERANAKWNWSFPGAEYVSDSTARNPKVLYGKLGVYPVTLTVKNDYGTDTYTNSTFIEIKTLECAIDKTADRALSLSTSNDVATIPALPVLKNAKGFTAMMWLKLDSIQFSFSQLLSNWSSNVGFSLGFSFQGYRQNTNLTFYWNNVPYQLTSAFNLPIGDWVHVAISVDTNKVTLFMNGEPWEYKNTKANFKDFDLSSTPWEIGGGLPGQGGNYRGQIEELRIFNRTYSTEEIRHAMHITEQKENTSLVGYYQFNESNDAKFYNRIGAVHSVNGGGKLVESTAPVASGISEIKTGSNGMWNFTKTGLTIADTYIKDDTAKRTLGVYRLFAEPDTMPNISGAQRYTNSYWIVRSWGNKKSLVTDSLIFKGVGTLSANDASNTQNFIISKRQIANEHRKTWLTKPATRVDSTLQLVTTGADSNVVGQYIIATLGNSPLGIEETTQVPLLQLLPNPAGNTVTAFINSNAPVTLRIINNIGQVVLTEQCTTTITTLNTTSLPNGIYTVQIESRNTLFTQKLILLR